MICGLQSDCRYVNNNEQITCRSHARALGANSGDGASFGQANSRATTHTEGHR